MNTVSAAQKWGIAIVWTILLIPGCGEVTLDGSTSVNATPKEVLDPLAPDEVRRDEASDKKAAKPAVAPKATKTPKSATESKTKKTRAKIISSPTARLGRSASLSTMTVGLIGDEASSAIEISLEPIKVVDLPKKIAANKKARLTMVDVWSTTCGPCMLNMPHVVATEKKFGARGLAVVTLSTDDPEDAGAVARAKEFLAKQKAFRVKNYLDSTFQDAFETLDFTTMPAVFLYDSNGKLLKKYTWDDPDKQFRYDEVDKSVAAFLDGKPLPKDTGDLPASK